ncbi:acyltransferase family protein [Rhodanobacter ginsengisoli]|uniref:Acyltransferase family protein n=1 Tax=Rhodanobacter ginsengisoli TaxID=418646 RepID=A0ABW0QVV2_9GAMM
MMLSDFEKRRDNNFTFLRFILAWSVLIGHSFPISANGSDPISRLLLPYAWIGSIAVSGFFAISGYLVTASFTKRGATAFVASRALRLYPAVIVYSLVAILLIGPLCTSVSLEQYFHSNPWANMWNATLWEWKYNLPYVFSHNHFAGATNGSSWTLPVELRCYLLVVLLGFFGVLDTRIRASAALVILLAVTHFSSGSLPLFEQSSSFASPLTFFLLGSLAWINRTALPLNWALAIAASIGPFAAVEFGHFEYVYPICLTYLLFIFTYRLPHFDMDRLGDISYGVYIYAWPIQQLVWRPGQSAYMNILLSTVIVFPIAYLSWRLIEKPAMGLRKKLPSFGERPAKGRGLAESAEAAG